MDVLVEAGMHLENMRHHTDCCGTPIVRKLVAEVRHLRAALFDQGEELAREVQMRQDRELSIANQP